VHGRDLEPRVLLQHTLSAPTRHFDVGRDMGRRDPHGDTRGSTLWPVVVEAGKRFFLLRAVNVSGRGAKVSPMERLGEGSVAQLHFHPPDGSSLDVQAIVWRVD
jgi:hypothetical protein